MVPFFPSTVTYEAVEEPIVVKQELTVEEVVRQSFKDTPDMIDIARCESGFRQFYENGEVLRGIQNSQDVGVMQINEFYHLDRSIELGYDIHTLEGNIAFAKLLYKESGAKPWRWSAPCHGHY